MIFIHCVDCELMIT